MVQAVVTIYLIGWAVGTMGVYLAGRRLNDDRDPATHQFLLSAVAGAFWPLLLIGTVELSSLAACSSAASHLTAESAELVGAGVVPLR